MNPISRFFASLFIVCVSCSHNTPVAVTEPLVPQESLANRPEMTGQEVVAIKPEQTLPKKIEEENECLKNGGRWEGRKNKVCKGPRHK